MIWIAILVVASQMIAGRALAHAGHAHHPAGVVVAQHASIEVPASAAEQAAREPEHFPAAGPVAVPVDSAASRMDAAGAGCGGCAASCCGAGAGCCGAVLPAPSPASADLRTARRLACPALDRRGGVDPDALRKPPKLLA
jgi:hypothetical protein